MQTGVRIEKRIVKVLKAVAAEREMSLGDLLEGVCLHAFEGKQAFGPAGLEQIAQLKELFGLDLTAADSHQLKEKGSS